MGILAKSTSHIVVCPELDVGRANPQHGGEELVRGAVDGEGNVGQQLGELGPHISHVLQPSTHSNIIRYQKDCGGF